MTSRTAILGVIQNGRLRWVGHLERVVSSRLPTKLMYEKEVSEDMEVPG